MTAPHIVDPARLLGQALGDASPDLMRHLLATVINALLSAEADAVCGAEWGQPSPDRVTQRNGYRHRELDRPGGPQAAQTGATGHAAGPRPTWGQIAVTRRVVSPQYGKLGAYLGLQESFSDHHWPPSSSREGAKPLVGER